MEFKLNGETYYLCPYNGTHQISQKKYQAHILKCRAAAAAKLRQEGRRLPEVKCKFNDTHSLPAPEIGLHHLICPSKNDVLPGKSFCFGDYVKQKNFKPKETGVPGISASDEEEDWAVECERDRQALKDAEQARLTREMLEADMKRAEEEKLARQKVIEAEQQREAEGKKREAEKKAELMKLAADKEAELKKMGRHDEVEDEDFGGSDSDDPSEPKFSDDDTDYSQFVISSGEDDSDVVISSGEDDSDVEVDTSGKFDEIDMVPKAKNEEQED